MTRAEVVAFALWDPEGRELAIVYVCDADGARSRVCEMPAFDDEGRVARGEVMRGADLFLTRGSSAPL